MKPSEIIREGRNRLFERGWTIGTLLNGDGRVCAVGALFDAVGVEEERLRSCDEDVIFADFPDALRAARCLGGVVGAQGLPGHKSEHDIIWFNDAKGRTFQEVIDAFDKAEKIAEARES